ncbi:MAG: hypothetical protein Q4D48_05760 [Coriobacteriales bacterium]|nr:hypothetical protein [Coriobacteriales bacterium]
METPSSRYTSRCAICGKPARVFLGSTSYCQDCYNRLADYLAGVETPTNDSYQILALDPDGHTVEFSVERYSFGARSIWTAVEQVPADDPRREWGYVGRSVSIAVDATRVSQDQAFDALMVKAQHMVSHASMRTAPISLNDPHPTTARRLGRALYANETGVARIEASDDGQKSVVVDGQCFTPEQFVDLLSCWDGFDLYWQVRGAADEPPTWL